MEKNKITICQNQFHLENYIRSKNTPIQKILTFKHFISQKLTLNNYKNNEDYKTVQPIEEKVLIKKLIEKSLKTEHDFELYNINAITDLFIDAIKIIENEKLNINNKEWFLSRETLFFRKIYLQYLENLKEHNLLTITESLNIFTKVIDKNDEEFIAVGFLKKNKLIEEFLSSINNSLNIAENKDEIFRGTEVNIFEETEYEMLHVSTECIKHISENKKCAIIVPNLDKYIDQLTMYFSDPVLLKKQKITESIIVNSSVKKSLSHSYVIQNLINLFSFLNNIPVDIFLLKKSFKQILQLEKFIEINKFFDYLFIDGVKKINFIEFKKLFTFFNKNHDIEDKEHLESLIFELEIKKVGNDLAGRCSSFMNFINYDFFKFQNKNVNEINHIKAFYNILNELINLKISNNKISFSDFLYILKEQIRITTEPSLVTNNKRIDIYGLFDEIIDSYDYIYATNLTDELLEIEKNYNPFVPAKFINEINQLKNTEQIIKQIFNRNKNMCKSLYLSYSKFNLEVENTPSAFIKNCTKKYISPELITTILDSSIRYINDNKAPKINKPYKVKNIINLLNTYTISPLWTFYESRLGCKPIESLKQEKFNSRTRGIVIHESMQKIWEELKDQKTLQDKKNNGSLVNFVKTKVANVLDSNLYCQKIHQSLKQIESNNFISIILGFLEIELERESFVNKNLEYKQNAEIEGISFEYRIDRIDETDDLSLIIDYKSGSNIPAKNQWLSETIQSHQVPIYLLFTKLNKDTGFGFFSINNKFMQINYYFSDQESQSSENIKYVKSPFKLNELKEKWAIDIKEKINFYSNGYADLNFNNEEDFIFCNLSQILRIPEYKYLQENNNGR